MKERRHYVAYFFAALALTVFCVASAKAEVKPLDVKVEGISPGKPIPEKHAFCRRNLKDGNNKVPAIDGDNISPAISWDAGPEGTQSYAIVMVDEDVPVSFEDANQHGKTVSTDIPRRDFYHWVLVDIAANTLKIPQGAESDGLVKTGKHTGKMEYGLRGVNSFGEIMPGSFGGYDGPCPPWNDEKKHRYHFRVYALDVPSLTLSGEFGAKEALAAMEGHILAKGEVMGTYTLNPRVR